MFAQDLTTDWALVSPIAEVSGRMRLAFGEVEHALQSQNKRA